MRSAKEIYDERFNDKGAVPRSKAYKQGVKDQLYYSLEKKPITKPYKDGTAECDAYFAGLEAGNTILACEFKRANR